MLRPYHSRPHQTGTPNQSYSSSLSSRSPFFSVWNRSKRTITTGLVGMMVVILLVAPAPGSFLRRRSLALQCIHNIYAKSTQMALDMPPPPKISGDEIPSSITICQEWVRRDRDSNLAGMYVQEDDGVCLDWTAPHYRLLEIFASQILDKLNDASRYRHDCFRSRVWDEGVSGLDRTTVQHLLSVARMEPRKDLITTEELKDQCKICLEQLDLNSEQSHRIHAKAAHHCIAWPQSYDGQNIIKNLTTTGKYGTILGLPKEPEKPNVIPLSSIHKAVRGRVQYVAKIFSNVTDAPPDELTSGVVIYLDTSSYAVDKSIYPLYFPDTVTSITIVANPLCAVGYLPTGEVCSVYGAELESHFRFLYPGLSNTGHGGSNGVQFQIVGSTAGLYSRMIMSKRLICPPHTINCLIPAFSKLYEVNVDPPIETDAYVMESTDWGQANEFFTVMGTGDRVTVEEIDSSGSGRRLTSFTLVDPPTTFPDYFTSSGQIAAPIFEDINEVVDSDGYKTNKAPPAAMTRTEVAALSDAQVLTDVNTANSLPDISTNPNAYHPELEDIVSYEYAVAAKASNTPINLNYKKENTTQRATREIGLDIDLGMAMEAATVNSLELQKTARQESEIRIAEEKQLAKIRQLEEAENGIFPPSMEMEVFCPDFTPDGFEIHYDAGTVVTDRGTELLVSDGAGTVRFDRSSVVSSTQTIPRLDDTTPYTHIYDPHTKSNITITGKNITYNKNQGLLKPDPIGVLMVDNYTNPISGTLITEGGTGNYEAGNNQKVYSGTILATGPNRAKEGDVVRHGRGYAIRTNPEPGLKRTIYGWWNGFLSSSSESSSESGGSGYQGNYNRHSRRKASSSDEGNPTTSDSRDIGREVVYNATTTRRTLRQKDRKTSQSISTSESADQTRATARAKELANVAPGDGGKAVADANVVHADAKPRMVAIKIPAEDFKFGDPQDLERICTKHKDKVNEAVRAQREQEMLDQKAFQRKLDRKKQNQQDFIDVVENDTPGAGAVGTVENVQVDGASARRTLRESEARQDITFSNAGVYTPVQHTSQTSSSAAASNAGTTVVGAEGHVHRREADAGIDRETGSKHITFKNSGVGTPLPNQEGNGDHVIVVDSSSQQPPHQEAGLRKQVPLEPKQRRHLSRF